MSFFEVADTSYDNFMGRYSSQLAPLFADFAGIREGLAVVDVGAGTGALTSELVRRGAEVAAADPSGTFVTALQARLPDIAVHAAPAEHLPWPDERFHAALAQLVVTFMDDAPAGVQEMRRVVQPGGTVAVAMWDREGMEMLAAVHRTQRALASDTPAVEARTLYRTREEIESLFEDGFTDTQTELLAVESAYSGFEELWSTILGGAGPAGAWLVSLDEQGRAAAHERLYEEVGAPEGAFTLAAKAWATRATRA
jgi:ubiquinone/menaquinone biosynthesis C-methylase UbiE